MSNIGRGDTGYGESNCLVWVWKPNRYVIRRHPEPVLRILAELQVKPLPPTEDHDD